MRLKHGLVCLALLVPASGAYTQDRAPEFFTLGEDVYAAGERVFLSRETAGDAVLAGGEVEVGAPVRADLIAAAGNLRIQSAIGDDVRVAGGQVRLGDVEVGDSVVAAGGSVALAPGARLGGSAALAGGEVRSEATIAGALFVAAGHAAIGGRVAGDVRVESDRVEILPNARIGGRLIYRSANEAVIGENAHIAGGITREEGQTRGPAVGAVWRSLALVWWAGLLILGALLIWVFPRFMLGSSRQTARAPFASLGLGFALLVLMPVVAIAAFITLVGVPLGLLLLPAWIVLCLLGFLVGALFWGELGLSTLMRGREAGLGRRILSFAATLILLALIGLIPILGFVVWLATLLLGMGGILIRIWTRRKPPGDPREALVQDSLR